jgi:hypothetical protein
MELLQISSTSLTLIITAAGAFITFCYTLITFFLWRTTQKAVRLNALTVEVLTKQVNHQIALSYTTSQHKIIDSHREMFLNILRDEDLLRIFASDAGVAPERVHRRFLGTFLINHCLTIFLYHANQVVDNRQTENFVKDARALFRLPLLRERWEEVKTYHPTSFQTFVDNVLLSDEVVDYKKFISYEPLDDSLLSPWPKGFDREYQSANKSK